jgi:hypothetical protein
MVRRVAGWPFLFGPFLSRRRCSVIAAIAATAAMLAGTIATAAPKTVEGVGAHCYGPKSFIVYLLFMR